MKWKLYIVETVIFNSALGSVWLIISLFSYILQDDITLKGYHSHKRNVAAPAPLTQAEEELAFVKKTETNAHISIDSKHQTLSGVAFPVAEAALKAIYAFQEKEYNYIQLSIGTLISL